MRTAYFGACVAALAVLASGATQAQQNVCVDLEAQLARIDRGQTGAGDPHQFDAPITQQQNLLDRAIAEARRAGCVGGFLFFKPTPDAKCGRLLATINQMQANQQKLIAQQEQMGGGDPYRLADQRSGLMRALAENNCGSDFPGGERALEDDSGGLFATLFGGRSMFRPPDDYATGDAGFGTYRTLCVRTCDGFYFPISFSTVPGQFGADAAACQAACPGAEAVLYTHRNPGEDVSQMVSLDGQPYTALPNAFRFRTQFDRACTCHAAPGSPAFTQFPTDGGVSPITGAPIDGGNQTGPTMPLPNIRPLAAGEDPATLDDRAGGLIPAPVTKAEPAATATDEPRKVRIVGPNYYYGQ
jgi:Protein of unknown function (DUF2865)